MCSSPAQNTFVTSDNMFVCSVILICIDSRDCLIEAMNAFVCSVKSYSEVGSRDYLVASDKRISTYLEVGLETTKKTTETKGKMFWNNFISS